MIVTIPQEDRTEKPDTTCTRCGGQAQWQPQWGTYMHWEENQEDTHAVTPPAPQP